MNNILVCNDLTKNYGAVNILDTVSFSYSTSEIIAIKGANGVGKSTLLSILAGAEPLDQGTITIDDIDLSSNPIEAKQKLSYAPDEATVYPFMTGLEFLRFIALIKKVDAEYAVSIAERFTLGNFFRQRFDRMSLGTQKKFLLSASFTGKPKLIILDEPTNGLDDKSRNVFLDYLLESKEQRLVIISTHDNSIIEQSNAKIAYLDNGKLN